MKKIIIMLATIALVGCQSYVEPEQTDNGSKEITFSVHHNYGTRASLQGDGGALTDLWIFDYLNGELAQRLHQSNTDENFGEPTLSLAYGEHHIYFVASRGSEPVLDTEAHTISFSLIRDTFWKDYALNVTSTTSENRNVMLDRAVTRLRLVFDDEVPEGMATLNVRIATWYSGINYLTGEPSNMEERNTDISVPASFVGTSGHLVASIYGFSGATEWTSDVTITASSATDVLGTVTRQNVPFLRNRITELHGNIFNSAGGLEIGLNTEWLENYTDSW